MGAAQRVRTHRIIPGSTQLVHHKAVSVANITTTSAPCVLATVLKVCGVVLRLWATKAATGRMIRACVAARQLQSGLSEVRSVVRTIQRGVLQFASKREERASSAFESGQLNQAWRIQLARTTLARRNKWQAPDRSGQPGLLTGEVHRRTACYSSASHRARRSCPASPRFSATTGDPRRRQAGAGAGATRRARRRRPRCHRRRGRGRARALEAARTSRQ